jgi:hypothetical protein
MRVSLVASSNGLGHARRLLNLIPGFEERVNSLSLFLSIEQARLLKAEIQTIQRKIDFVVIESKNFGLDAFHLKNLATFEDITSDCKKQIASSDIVISDNSAWPAKYNENFYLFGHFDWVSYYKVSAFEQLKDSIISDQLANEFELLVNSKAWFRTKEFGFNSAFNLKVIEVPLLRYQSDNFDSKARGDEIWFANGTTGENISTNFGTTINPVDIVRCETFRMNIKPNLPKMVFGRPGLGTIRDCLASRTYFHPLWEGRDVELESNSEHLHRLGLFKNLTENSNLGVFNDEEISFRIKRFWEDNSATSTAVVDLILDNIG